MKPNDLVWFDGKPAVVARVVGENIGLFVLGGPSYELETGVGSVTPMAEHEVAAQIAAYMDRLADLHREQSSRPSETFALPLSAVEDIRCLVEEAFENNEEDDFVREHLPELVDGTEADTLTQAEADRYVELWEKQWKADRSAEETAELEALETKATQKSKHVYAIALRLSKLLPPRPPSDSPSPFVSCR